MANLVYCEVLKLKRSKMLLISFLGALVTPVMMTADGVKMHYSEPGEVITLAGFYNGCTLYTMLLFGLIVYVVIAGYLFSREHTEKTLKLILPVPVSKASLVVSKLIMLFLWIMALTIITWLSMFFLAAVYGAMFGLANFGVGVAIQHLGEMIFGGALMFFTLSPFVFLTIRTKGLVVPIIAAATIAMGNVALTNEALGALFPWTATFLLVDSRMTQTSQFYPLAIGLIAFISTLGLLASVIYFQREDVN